MMSLEKRITKALHASSRLRDVETLISEVDELIEQAEIAQQEADAKSVDPALTTAEAREARNQAADFAHDVRRLGASLSALKDRRTAILEDSEYEERQQRFAAARAERDELIGVIRARYPVLALEIYQIAQRIQASDQELAEVNKRRPRGEDALVSAEMLARGITGYSWAGMEPVMRIEDALLPLLSSGGLYLPLNRAPTSTPGWEEKMQEDQRIADRASQVTVASLETLNEAA